MSRRLIVVGRGATAERVAELAGRLGYEELQVVEEIPKELDAGDHVVIAADDAESGRMLLGGAIRRNVLPAYLGYAAPHREGWKALVQLAAEEVEKARLDMVSAPAGVDVGAETPDEVAIAVAAELVAVRRGRRRPSQGLPISSASKRPLVEARPRRLLGGRDKDSGSGDSGGGGAGGRN
jgi:xanthine/CO dehydrogenase XdhC/CoxF family maturation factor